MGENLKGILSQGYETHFQGKNFNKYKLFIKAGDRKTLNLALIPYNSVLMVTLNAF